MSLPEEASCRGCSPCSWFVFPGFGYYISEKYMLTLACRLQRQPFSQRLLSAGFEEGDAVIFVTHNFWPVSSSSSAHGRLPINAQVPVLLTSSPMNNSALVASTLTKDLDGVALWNTICKKRTSTGNKTTAILVKSCVGTTPPCL